MKSSDKVNEIERQVKGLNASARRFEELAKEKNVRITRLLESRDAMSAALSSGNNALVCSLLYSEDAFSKQLTLAKKRIEACFVANEKVISQRVTPAAKELASTPAVRVAASLQIENAREGFTAFKDGESVVPVYYLTFANIADASSYEHERYSIWFKSPREFATGFMPWPTSRNWHQVANQKQLLPAVLMALKEDGFSLKSLRRQS